MFCSILSGMNQEWPPETSSLPGYELISPDTKEISLPHYALIKKDQQTNTSGTDDAATEYVIAADTGEKSILEQL